MPPSCTTSAQKPAGSVNPPLFASQDGRPFWPRSVAEPAAPTHVSTSARSMRFMGEFYRLLNEGAMNARQHSSGAAAAFADEIELAAASKCDALTLRFFEALQVDT